MSNNKQIISEKRNINFLNAEMRLYIAYCLTHPNNPKDFREIKCEECPDYRNLEFHHKKYAPEDNIYLNDIRIECCKCHRNSKPSIRKRSQLQTVFENGKRYCETANYKFEY